MQNWQTTVRSAVSEINAPTSSVGALHEAPEISVIASHPSVTKKQDLQKPSPAEKVPRNEADEEI
ncbi:MAG: hypothetical protein IJW52_00130 [Clostridia bacterium]|nr:hypothetical protein [Clostridia bacterium]